MPWIRRRLSWVLSGWLVLQLAGMIAPVALAASGHPIDEELCTCPAGMEQGATCPMHHGPKANDAAGSSSCSIRSTQSAVDAALLSLMGCAGLLPASTPLDAPVVEPFPIVSTESSPSRTELPDLLPPRS